MKRFGNTRMRSFLAFFGILSLMMGCPSPSSNSTSTPAPTPTPTPTPAPATTLSVSGVVQDYGTGNVIAGVTMTAAGGASVTTDATGAFTVSVPMTSGRGTINAAKTGFANNSRVVLDGEALTNLSVMLSPVSQSFAAVDPSVSQTLSVTGTAAGLDLGGGVLADRAGRALVAGSTVSVDLTNINPLSAPETMPGDFSANTNGTTGQLESFGALGVQIRDPSGNTVNLGTGKTATVRIAVPAGSATPPSTIPLFYYNETQGVWVQDGTASLVGTSPTWYYQGSVSHFSTWNADQIYTRVMVTGKVVDSTGAALVGANVTATGQSYNGTSTVRSDASGNFSIYVKSSSTALIKAEKSGRTSNTMTITTTTVTLDKSSTPLVIGSSAGITIKLEWGQDPRDLDSHLTGPVSGSTTRFHVYFGSRGSLTSAPFANLDVDDTSGFGPEVITVQQLTPGTYRYSVHQFSGSSTITASPARVTANINGTIRVFNPPSAGAAGVGDVWTVFEFTVDSTGTVTAITPKATYTANQYSSGAVFSLAQGGSGGKVPLPPQVLAQF